MAVSLFNRANNGEFIVKENGKYIKKKYKPDTVFDKSFVPYLIMFLCAAIDLTFFLDLFKWISYENMFMIAMEVAGMVFAFDVVPIYCGIQFRRVKQGINKDKFLIWIAMAVFVIACATNIALRIISVKVISADTSAATFFGTSVTDTVTEVSPATVAVTVFACVVPLLTSIGSFFISYMCYSPLKVRKKNLEELLSSKEDDIRRFNAYLDEYDADSEHAEHLKDDDYKKYAEMKKLQRAKVITYCTYVRQKLQEHLGDPTSINVLSEEDYTAVIKRLDEILAAIDATDSVSEPSDAEDEIQFESKKYAA